MKIAYKPPLTLAFAIFLLLAIPENLSTTLRGYSVAFLAPFWSRLVEIKLFLKTPFEFSFSRNGEGDLIRTRNEQVERLLLENQLLSNELVYLKDLVELEYSLFQQFLDDPLAQKIDEALLTRHQKETLNLFNVQLMRIPARVIFRPLNLWDSSLWIDKGFYENGGLGRTVIAKNSPVVVGTSIVGVIDEVREKQSKVRLITDSGLNPSVRIRRGTSLLAKGELRGESKPLWRSHSSLLKGVGFNYDFADEEGPPRDLRSGEILLDDRKSKHGAIPLVQLGDLLVTTGMDGVFPKGLKAGVIKKIFPLKEGDFSYDIEAECSAGDLNNLSVVFVLPPVSSSLD